MDLQDVFAVAAAVLASLGGASVLVLALSGWLGRLWAQRMLQGERAEHERVLERLRSELRGDVDQELERLRASLQGDMDVLLRRREVYERLIVSMRVFLGATSPAGDNEKREFLRAYDAAMLWASDSVVEAVGAFLDINKASLAQQVHAPAKALQHQISMQQAYSTCVIEMRRDAGFPNTRVEPVQYRIVEGWS